MTYQQVSDEQWLAEIERKFQQNLNLFVRFMIPNVVDLTNNDVIFKLSNTPTYERIAVPHFLTLVKQVIATKINPNATYTVHIDDLNDYGHFIVVCVHQSI